MKIHLIVPAVGDSENGKYIRSWQMQPLTMAALAGCTPGGHEVKLYDDRVEKIDYDDPCGLAAISVETYSAKRAYQIAAQYKKRGVPVVMGGYHATLMPEETALHADAVFTGGAEETWGEMLKDLENGRLKKVYAQEKTGFLKGLKKDRKIFEGKNYMPITLVETSRGCRFNCNFCSITSFYGQTCSYRPAAEVAAEVEALNKKLYFFVDDNISGDFEKAYELFGEIEPLKIKWISQAGINAFRDEKFLKKMKKSGCEGLLIGFESLDNEVLKSMGKAWNTGGSSYADTMKKIRDSGISIYATFVMGYDGDTPETFGQVTEFARKSGFFMAAFNHLVPFPGTPLYSRLENERRLIYDRWWMSDKFRFGDVCYRPKLMEPETLAGECVKARKEFYSTGSIINRAFDFKNNIKNPAFAFYYFAINSMLQQEVTMKRKIMLGRPGEGET
jgi:radical SAM superfamily enzyme YgiQ (UPF0313 family)